MGHEDYMTSAEPDVLGNKNPSDVAAALSAGRKGCLYKEMGIDMIDADSPLEVLSGGPQELRGASFSSISTWSSVHLQDYPMLDRNSQDQDQDKIFQRTSESSITDADGIPHQDIKVYTSGLSYALSIVMMPLSIPSLLLYRTALTVIYWMMSCTASTAVTVYDVLMRAIMVSYYIIGLDEFASAEQYLASKAIKQSRRYVESSASKYQSALDSGALRVTTKTTLSKEDVAFARHILTVKHSMPIALYWSWRAFMMLIQTCAAPGTALFSTVTDGASGEVVALFVDFRQRTMHHFITALVDHEASHKYGIYVAKYQQLLTSCVRGSIPLLRLGPTCGELKTGLGAIPLPLMVVGTCVWAKLEGRCAVVSFGIFTSVALFLYMALTQWHLDASSVGALTPVELLILYTSSMGCVKLLPLWSIGFAKIISNPRKYLLQTSFYAQGMIPGALLAIAIIAARRDVSPLLLLDGLCLFGLIGETIGRLGCHFYGCCFGRPSLATPGSAFSAFSVVYINKTSSVARLRPEFLLRPLLPTQLLQTLYALVSQTLLLAYVASLDGAAASVTPHSGSSMRVGMVSVWCLTAYSVGRLMFFMVREDENFKSNRSYTTAYMAIATLAGAALLAAYSLNYATLSPITLLGVSATPDQIPSNSLVRCIVLASVMALINFVVQALHHHEKIGRFPDLTALLGLPLGYTARPTTAAHNRLPSEGMWESGRESAIKSSLEREPKKPRQQVLSSWGDEAVKVN